MINTYVTIQEINELRDKTQIGSFIKFTRAIAVGSTSKKQWVYEDICGFVSEKYPFIFILYDGTRYATYTWSDYKLGFIY